MVTNCWVPHCRSRWYKYCEIKFHTFPVDKKMRRLWASRIMADRLPSDSAKVCSLHFCKSDYEPNLASDRVRLKKTAVPSRNLDSRTAVPLKTESKRAQIAVPSPPQPLQQPPQQQPAQLQKQLSFKMRIKKNPTTVNVNGGWKTDNEFTVPVDPYYMYDDNYDSSTPARRSTTYANPYTDEHSLLQESGTQSDDNSIMDHHSLSINDHQSYAEYETAATAISPSPDERIPSHHNLRKRRRSVFTGDDHNDPPRSSPAPQYHQRLAQAPLLPPAAAAVPPKLRVPSVPIKRSSASTKPCEAELVDGFCKYLAMQLKRLSAQLFLDVQMDVQQIVLQAQRTALDTMDSGGDYDAHGNDALHTSARLPNGSEAEQQHTAAADQQVLTRKGGDDELDWEECQIKSEPIDDEEIYVNIDEEPDVTILDTPPTSVPLLTAMTIVMPTIDTNPFPILSLEPTPLPEIALIADPTVDQTQFALTSPRCVSPTPSLTADTNREQHPYTLTEPSSTLEADAHIRPNTDPDASASTFDMSIDRTSLFQSDIFNDNTAYKDIGCAVSTLSDTVSTLSTTPVQHDRSLYFISDTKPT